MLEEIEIFGEQLEVATGEESVLEKLKTMYCRKWCETK